MFQPVLHHLTVDRDNAVRRLIDLLSIPSVSTDPAYKADVVRAAQWVAGQLREVGLDVVIHDTGGHPAVVAKTKPQDVSNPAAPRVLFYGHYDVQPPDPLELWESPPFKPVIKDGAIVARGASDDKGQVMCFIEALRAWRAAGPGAVGGKGGTGGKFPGPVTVLIEGEEECGSVNLQPFIEKHKDLLACDVVVISDTCMWDTPTGPIPAITYALRGLLYFDIQLHGPSRDLHSGVYGGTLANPCTILTRVLGQLFDDHHRVVIPGYYNDVAPLSAQEREEWDKLQFDEKAFLSGVGSEPYGEVGYSTLERRWCRPACDINGLYGGYMKEGAKTVLPSFAGAKVSFRLAANQDPRKIADAFTKWLHDQPTHGLRWKITPHGEAAPVAVATDSPFIEAARRAIKTSAGREPVLIREGATIPVVADFKRSLAADSLLVGFGLNNDRIHSPNEKFELACFTLGCRTHAVMLAELAADSSRIA